MLPIDQQMTAKVRGLIKHFKQDDPRGIPSEMGDLIKDPMPIPNLEQSFSGARVKFEDMSVYGLSKFRLDYARALVSELKVRYIAAYLKKTIFSIANCHMDKVVVRELHD